MRSRLVIAFVGVTVVVLAVAWSSVLLSDEVSDALLLPFLLGSATLVAAAGVGVVIADRLSRPFRELSAAAVQIGEGRFDAEIPRYSIPEADAMGRSLRDAAARLDGMVKREQAVAVTASHELRTPITALRLSLEDLTLWENTPPDVSTEIGRSIAELDRLTRAVTRLLDQRHDSRPAERTDLAAVVGKAVHHWRSQAGETQQITLGRTSAMPADLAETTVRQVLDAMLGHATTHSSNGVRVDVSRQDGRIRVEVGFDDARELPTGVIHGTATEAETGGDAALAAAGAIAESLGGYLGVADVPGTCLALTLPAADAGSSLAV
jgi:signal transduction histidine kinase